MSRNKDARYYDVWRCYTGARTTYKAVPSKGADLDQIQKPENADAHLDRVWANSKRDAVRQTLGLIGKRTKAPSFLSKWTAIIKAMPLGGK
jgi:hypothetical protein